MSDKLPSKITVPTVTDVCPTCGGNLPSHIAGCAEAPVSPERAADRRISETTQLALAVDRISKALAATPMNIALGALATVVGQAQYHFQKDPVKRNRNLSTFFGTVTAAIHMTQTEEALQAQQREAAQKSDPIRKLN